MTDSLYEHYKDALRRGHVATLRGRLDEALADYVLAAELAPDRPLPYVSQGNVHARAGRPDQAHAAFAEALRRAPRDEAALAGQADLYVRGGRRIEAAETLDILAEVHEAAGRLAEACDTARLALEQAESKTRRRHVEELTRALRASGGDDASEQALTRALLMLEGPMAPRGTIESTGFLETAGADGTSHGQEPESEPEQAAEPEPDVAILAAEADDALEAGDLQTARERLLRVARAHGAAGRHAAALDACYQALAIAPSHPDVHLILIDLYIARGWRSPAIDKLVLLARLVDLDADATARDRLCKIVAEWFPAEPRLAALCA
jgi:tetratricopeptide (TPR) repeat protein